MRNIKTCMCSYFVLWKNNNVRNVHTCRELFLSVCRACKRICCTNAPHSALKVDDRTTKGIAFHSFLKIDAFLFIKSIAKWYERECVWQCVRARDTMRCVLFICLVLLMLGWLVRCPLGIVVILSPTSYTVIVIWFQRQQQQQPFMHTLLAHIILCSGTCMHITITHHMCCDSKWKKPQ